MNDLTKEKSVMSILKTKWYGIFIQESEVTGYWMFSDNGCEQFYKDFPTEEEQEQFKEEVTK